MTQPKCPICNKADATKDYAPFCSKRCADVDLSRWLGDGYAIPGETIDRAEDLPDDVDLEELAERLAASQKTR